MIVKSMSRKTPSFSQLIEYMSDIDKADERYNIYHNLYSRNASAMVNEYQHNASFAAKRKNGVYLYHEVLSFTRAEHLSAAEQKNCMREIAQEYAQRRAENNLIFATLHEDHKDHLHYHFLISSNAVGDAKKTRMSRVQFDRFKKDLEQRVLDRYPQLEQGVVINKKAREQAGKHSNTEAEVKRRTKKPTQKEQFREKLKDVFEQSSDKQDFFDRLEEAQIDIYTRGKNIGFLDRSTQRKHRLTTLGLVEEFEAINHTISQAENQSNAQQAKSSEQSKAEQPVDKSEPDQTKKSEDRAADEKENVELEAKRRREKMSRYRESKQPDQSDQSKHSKK
ncbi:relaxase/mobilization nuclease domain-containing protein [Gammaproteobacteria bacterium]|nr:relaxase/mobilization nuclease domain-containing protein [Gammaproteobacteria bacterium]